MIKVLEKRKRKTNRNFDSLIVEIPTDFALSHGLPEKSFVSLTLQDGKMSSEIISYSNGDEREIEEFLADFPGFDERVAKT